VIDGSERFVDEFDTRPVPPPDSSLDTMRDWLRGLFRSDPNQPSMPGGAPGVPGNAAPPVPAEERVGG